MPQPIIVDAVLFTPEGWGHRTEVMAEFSDGSIETVVAFFRDELFFSAREFIGLTSSQATALHMQRDIAYLQS